MCIWRTLIAVIQAAALGVVVGGILIFGLFSLACLVMALA
jgi:hypothetical protein